MLTKLFKYDMKDALNKALTIYSVLAIAASVLARILKPFEDASALMAFLSGFCTGLCISMICSLIINVLIRNWVHFGEDFYKDRSYLIHTLPVSKASLYFSKLLSAAMSLLISFGVSAVALAVMLYSKENLELFKNFISSIATMYNSSVIGYVIVILAEIYLQILVMLQSGYIGILLGYKRQNGKVGFSILFGAAIYVVGQCLILLGLFASSLIWPEIRQIFVSEVIVDGSVFKAVMFLAIVLYSLLSAIGVTVGILIFKKGVNVE